MQVSSLVLLCIIFVQGKRVKGKEGVFLHCVPPKDQTVTGNNLTVDCQINSTAHHDTCNFSDVLCWYNGKLNIPCVLNKTENPNKISNVTVEIYNVTTSGNYTLRIATDCGHRPVFTFEVTVTDSDHDSERSTSPDKVSDKTNTIALVLGSLGAFVALVAGVILAIRRWRTKQREYQPPNSSSDPEAIPGQSVTSDLWLVHESNT